MYDGFKNYKKGKGGIKDGLFFIYIYYLLFNFIYGVWNIL